MIDVKIMKQQIRTSIFETNSSSTHTISISRSDEYKSVLEKMSSEGISFTSGEFGWEYEVYSNTWDKASYLWTGIIKSDYYKKDEVEKIKENIKIVLNKYGISPSFEPYKEDSYNWGDEKRFYLTFDKFAYVDHGNDLDTWLDAMFPNKGEDIDEELLLEYLFNSNSYVATGNDNEDGSDYYYEQLRDIKDEDNIEFYKGN